MTDKQFIHKGMAVNIISSSSKGNCTIINNDIMIDIGVPYTSIEQYVMKLKYILITHIHCDHINLRTLKKVLETNPFIKIFTNDTVMLHIKGKPSFKNFGSLNFIDTLMNDKYYCVRIPGKHSTEVSGFAITSKAQYPMVNMCYMTDSWDMSKLEMSYLEYDIAMIEGNHCEHYTKIAVDDILNSIGKMENLSISKELNGQLIRLQNSGQHATQQHANQLLHKILKKDGVWIHMHRSNDYYRELSNDKELDGRRIDD